jgi:hypothetical protein
MPFTGFPTQRVHRQPPVGKRFSKTHAIEGNGFSHSRFTITAIYHIGVALSSANAFFCRPIDTGDSK